MPQWGVVSIHFVCRHVAAVFSESLVGGRVMHPHVMCPQLKAKNIMLHHRLSHLYGQPFCQDNAIEKKGSMRFTINIQVRYLPEVAASGPETL